MLSIWLRPKDSKGCSHVRIYGKIRHQSFQRICMLKKENIFPGAVFEVRSDRPLNNGFGSTPGGGLFQMANTVPHVVARSYIPGDETFALQPGDGCEVVFGPKKKDGVNLVQVRSLSTGKTGCIFWCEFRCNFVLPSLKLNAKI